nr:hypothetical protein [Brucella anthropi]
MRHRIERFAQLVRDRQAQPLPMMRRALQGRKLDAVADQVLPAKLDQIGAPDAQVQHQLHSQPGHRAYRIGSAKARQFRFAPGVEAGRFMNFRDARHRIERREIRAYRPVEQRLEIFNELVRCAWRLCSRHLAGFNVRFADLGERQVADVVAVSI